MATPPGYGTACGSCGGTINCSNTCSVSTPANYNAACGSCGGKITCAGTCSIATPSNYGTACGICGATIACDGTCQSVGATVLASGTLIAAATRANSTSLTIGAPGTITAVNIWSDGGSITSFFKHTDATNYGWGQGVSPLTLPSFTVTSADVSAGTTWMFYVTSNDTSDHTVSYSINRCSN